MADFLIVTHSLPMISKLKKAVTFSGILSGVPEENSGKSREKCGKFRDVLSIVRFWVPERQNMMPTFGRHCPGPCPLLRGVSFFERDPYKLLEFF